MALQHVMRPVRVVSYGLAAKHGEGYLDPRSAGNALKVRYLVEGTVSESNGFDVVGVRLIDASDGALLWSERITLSQSNDAEGSHEVAIAQLANGLRPAIGAAEARRAAMVPAWSSSPMDLVFRANNAWNRDHSLEGTFAARKAYEDALRLDPGFSPALIGLGYTYQMQLAKASDPGVDRQGVVKQMDEVSSRAIRANPDDPGAWVLRGDALALQWRWDGAFEANGQALKLDPYLVGALHSRASLLIRTGQPDKALELLERAIELSPRGLDLHTSLLYRCRAMLAVGDFVAAIGACERALALGGSWWYPHLLLVAAYTLAGDTGNAAIERDRLFESQPGMSIARFKAHGASNDPVYLRQTEANIVGGLRMAGVPEE
jgi:tetratricopeptide (TPR) repeat protein